MTAFTKTAFAVFAIFHAACLPTGVFARKGDNGLFSGAKNSKEPTNKPTPRPTPIPSRRPTPIPSRRPTPIPSLRPTSMMPTVSTGKEEPPTMSPTTPPPTSDPTMRPSIPPAKLFYIMNPHTSKLISIKGGACFERSKVQLWEHSHADWQQFVLNDDSSLESVKCPGMVLDIAGSRCKNGRSIVISRKTNSASQRWSLREDGVIANVKCPNKGIDIRRYETQNGADLHLWSLHLKWNQIWEMKSASPTALPTISPSQSPTARPSSSPSRNPSSTPSMSPSHSPSMSPSSSPSMSPTISPTPLPTISPSSSPSFGPSVSPTTSPSVTPSLAPSSPPTVSPSGSPSKSPSFSPSAKPSAAPSSSPTFSPSLGPSLAPSSPPTISPSASPSRSPSESPSASPSVAPSSSPTSSPSLGPSLAPSSSPTVSPSASPSESPSESPSASPSVAPSSSPSTASPSRSPSDSPSGSPSRNPSGSPSETPTLSPPSTTISVPVTLMLDNFVPPSDHDASANVTSTLETTLKDVIMLDLDADQSVEDVTLTTIQYEIETSVASRSHVGLINVSFIVILRQKCGTATFFEGCYSDVNAKKIYGRVTSSLSNQISNGGFDKILKENALKSVNSSSLLSANATSGDFDKYTITQNDFPSSPTTSPSSFPSTSPSSSPTAQPTDQPTGRPHSAHPTSKEPTLSPIPDATCICEDSHEPVRNLLASEVSSVQQTTVPSQLRARVTDREIKLKGTEYVVDKSALESLLFKPPSVVFRADAAHRFVTDVVSLGSTTRVEFLEAQASTWGAHSSIRNFFGFTENDDVYNCSSVSAEELASYVNTCKSLPRKNHRIQEFFTRYYGKSEGNVTRSDSKGWVCAQRRLGRAFGWLHTLYHNSQDIPDYLMIVDDDTFIDQQAVLSYLQRETDKGKVSLAQAGCVFKKNGDSIPFALPYGGFGLFLNKDAIAQLSRSIYCDGINRDDKVCATLRFNSVGEFDIFTEGMTLFELFARFSATTNFCMHSDWLSGYIVEFYLRGIGRNDPAAQADYDDSLVGIKEYPMCGNRTAFSGHIRHCTKDSDTCHNQSPHDMEFFALSSYSRSPESYRSPPILAETDLSAALNSIKNIVAEKEVLYLPNVLMIGASETASFELADWLLLNGACNPEVFDDEPLYFLKEVHFFDKRFDQGIEFYAKHYQHCAQEESTDIILDATADYLYHPTRVFDLYSQSEQSLSDLKIIVMLRDPVAREAASYNRKVQEYQKRSEINGWFSDVAYRNGTIISFDDYAENVLTKRNDIGEYVNHLKVWTLLFGRENILFLSQNEAETDPKALQWRVAEFLGLRDIHINFKAKLPDTSFASSRASQMLYSLFSKSNKDLYTFLDNHPGPWMEQKPFPQYESPKRFAFATVLGWNPNLSQNKLYVDAVRVWIHSLRKSGTDFDIIVLMTYHDSRAESLLKADGAIVKLVRRIEFSQSIDEFEPWFVDIAFAKLRAFELTEYDRVQFFDADVAIENGSSLDNMFASFPNTELVAEGLGPDSPLRAGWMMIKPSQSNFNAMEKILQAGIFDKTRGWNQLDLPVDYPGWKSRSDWNFYGSSLEQGLLFHFFYALPKSKNPTDENSKLKLVGDEELHQFGLYHFYGNRKPWSKVRARVSGPMKSIQEQWLNMYKSLNANDTQEHEMYEYVVPLTKVGTEQYSQARVLYGYNGYLSPTTAPTTALKCECDGKTKVFDELV